MVMPQINQHKERNIIRVLSFDYINVLNDGKEDHFHGECMEVWYFHNSQIMSLS